VVWPNPRFTDNGNGTVTDNLTGLIWLKNANVFGARTWATALTDCATLNTGEGGVSDGSQQGDWRLPNVRELQSLVDYGRTGPSLPSGHPFIGIQTGTACYWSSTMIYPGAAWSVGMNYGGVYDNYMTLTFYVWPVRGGE
jgi:hypothetical protein